MSVELQVLKYVALLIVFAALNDASQAIKYILMFWVNGFYGAACIAV